MNAKNDTPASIAQQAGPGSHPGAEGSRDERLVRRAGAAALRLARWHVAYLDTNRAASMARGMTQRQWENGQALLRLAGATDERGRWLLHELPAIAEAVKRAAKTPGALMPRPRCG